MSSHVAENALKPLNEELQSTLQRVQQALEAYLEDPADTASLGTVADTVDRVRGAFTLLDRPTAASLAEEVVALARRLLLDPSEGTESVQDVLLRAVLHLEWLQRGGDERYLDLRPLLQELRLARGLKLDQADPAAKPGAVCRFGDLATRMRPQLQRALLGVLRGQAAADNLRHIAAVLARFKEAATDELAYRFWWLAEGLMLGAARGEIAFGPELHVLLRDLDHHVKHLKEVGEASYAEATVQELGQRIADRLSGSRGGQRRLEERIDYRSPSAGSEVAMLGQAGLLSLPNSDTLQQISAFLREYLALVKDAVDRFARSDARRPEALAGELERLHQVANVLTMLNMDVPARLIDRQMRTLRSRLAADAPLSDAELFDLATELILVEDSLDSVGEFVYSQTLAASPVSRPDAVGDLSLLRAVAHQHARVEAARAATHVIGQARQRVSLHLDGGAESPVWSELQSLLHAVGGALSLLECERAAPVMGRLEGAIDALAAHPAAAGDAQILGALAEVLVAIEYYLSLLGDNKRADNDILEHADRQLHTLEALIGGTPRQPFPERTAAPVEAQAPPAAAPPQPWEPELEDLLQEMTGHLSGAETLPETPEPAGNAEPAVAESVVDPEFMEVFLEEARAELASIGTQLGAWRDDLGDRQALASLRRSFHTLKGSGRMVGETEVGDLAWCIEDLLNKVIEGFVAASLQVVESVQAARAVLESMLDGGLSDGDRKTALAEVAAGAQTLLRGETAAMARSEQPSGGEAAQDLGEPAESLLGVPESASGEAVAPAGMDRELVDVFLYEAAEILDASDGILQRWSAKPADQALLNDLRRGMHTLKGSSRMAGFLAIGDLAHATESVLDAIAAGVPSVPAGLLELLQRTLDSLNGMLARVQAGEAITPADELIHDLNGMLGAGARQAKPPRQSPPPQVETALQAEAAPPAERAAAAGAAETIRVSASLLSSLVNQMGESSIYRARIDQGVGALRFNLGELSQTVFRLRQQLRRVEIETEAQILFRYEKDLPDHRGDFDPLELDRFSELQQLSRSLMEVVDDLVNIQHAMEDQAQDMGFLLDQQAKINKEIHQGLMRTRMVPLNSVAPRLHRVVRQACRESGKRAELVLQGAEAEVDRTILENMVAPLEHVLRNSIAHGIEAPAERRAAGKPEAGVITVSLRREGAEMVLAVSDDGAGLNFDAIRAKGEAKGMLSPGQPATEQDLIGLLLRPGFSTASQVTQLAGRGVGMDVLHNAIKAMRGALHIQSRRGRGVTFTVRLPFSLAVTQALLVRAGGNVYAVPLLSIEAVSRLGDGQLQAYLAGQAVEHGYGDHRFPLHGLGILFGGDPPQGDNVDARPPVLLFRNAEACAALQVDAVLGSQEIIVKPVGPQLAAVPGISGAAVLGDGRVVVVLDLAALVRRFSSHSQQQAEASALRVARQETPKDRISAMVIDDSITMRKVTARFLERHGIGVMAAKDGVDAVALLEEGVPDLVILDIEMPRMDGFEVVAHIRNRPHLRHLPIIMVTSRSGEKHRERAAKLGVNEYLVKPYQEEALMSAIRRVWGGQALALMPREIATHFG